MTPPTLTRSLSSQDRQGLLLSIEPLTPSSFSPFGTAISAPFSNTLNNVPAKIPEPLYSAHQPAAVFANQNSALKTSPISQFVDNYPVKQQQQQQQHYSSSADGDGGGATTRSKPQMSMFSCFPRNLSGVGIDTSRRNLAFKVSILERHPYTTQTFSPLGLSAADEESTVFLVIVAPSLSSPAAAKSSSSSSNPAGEGQDDQIQIQNPPDLSRLRAFVAKGDQAVTYAPGTWHAPMAVIGRRRVDFVVTQFVNGVADDDCQELLLGDNAVSVDLSTLNCDLDLDRVHQPPYDRKAKL
ncbi:hypothetical protein PV08_01882 [Exophiala spinifera]|uniref:Ureidoglycolate hydrolase n=1 Tax=Exophiala spinifera TaxID=91928 RepID=A0A0D2A938_9EURO|nr:uncharacterized protein PV08_01882 [Exophiala spinifera]KIW21302.1 hypothetical protein PV08_01882 [Exophiala spinifera]